MYVCIYIYMHTYIYIYNIHTYPTKSVNHVCSFDRFQATDSLGSSPLDQQQVGAGQHPDLVLGEQRWWGLKLSCN